jgi:hypothetical protein
LPKDWNGDKIGNNAQGCVRRYCGGMAQRRRAGADLPTLKGPTAPQLEAGFAEIGRTVERRLG